MKDLTSKDIKNIIKSLKSLNYKVFDRPNELNIIGERNFSTIPNKFDDKLLVFWKSENNIGWKGKEYPITTDPGTFWLKNPMNKLGTAILKQGQYINSYRIGKHQGKYDALTQNGKLTVIRDYDRNAILDFNNGREETGSNFGINIHRAGENSQNVDNWSAGCQVFQNSSDFDNFMDLARKHKDLYGNSFSYTLIDERANQRQVKRYLTYSLLSFLGIAATYVLIRSVENKPILPKFK